MAAPTPNAVIQLGLVTIPIKIWPAARNESADLVNLHRPCAEKGEEARLGQLKRCKVCQKEVPKEEEVKGWQKEDGTYLLFTPQEIAALQAEKSKGMEVRGFVPFADVDPIWLGPSNYIGPVDKTSMKVFMLLLELMKQEGLAAVVSYYGHGRDKRGIIRPFRDFLMLHDCFFPAEIREYSEARPAPVELFKIDFSVGERTAGVQLINSLRCDFTSTWMNDMPGDTFLARVDQLKEAREKGLPMPELPATPEIAVGGDLMALLQGSVTSIKSKRQINGDIAATSKPPVKVEASKAAAAKGKRKSA